MAGLIPQNFIDDLLDRVDLVEVINTRVPIKRRGKNYTACCPFHEEKTPSFNVTPDKQLYHCFGCGAGGNAIQFVMDYERVDFPRAIEILARSIGLEVPREASSQNPREEQQKRDIFSILERAAQFYREQLVRHPEASVARDYLQRRGLNSQIAERFGIGFAPPGWDNLLQALGTDDTARGLLMESGMLVEHEDSKRQHDRFRNRIMFPIRDMRGRVIAFGGRVLDDQKPKYLNSPETPVFHKGRELYGLYEAQQANRDLARIMVVEGYMDVIALAQFDITFATATLGTAAGADHLEKAFRQTSEVVFCFDGDAAGRRAAQRALEHSLPALRDGRQVRFMFLPDGEDPDTLIRKTGREQFIARVEKATPLSVFLFDHLGGGIDATHAEGRSQLITRALPLLNRVPEGVFRDQLFAALSAQTRTDSSSLQQLAKQQPAPRGTAPAAPATTPETPNPRQRPAQLARASSALHISLPDTACSLLLQHPELAREIALPDCLRNTENHDLHMLVALRDLLHELGNTSLNRILARWLTLYGEESSEALAGIAARERLISPEAARQQLQATLDRLEHTLTAGSRLDALIAKSRAEGLSDEEKNELNQRLTGTGANPAKT